MANSQLTAIFSQHTVYLNRVAASQGNAVVPYLETINSDIASIFSKYVNRKRITPELEAQIRTEIDEVVRTNLQAYIKDIKSDQREIGINEGKFSGEQLNKAVVDPDFVSKQPTAAQLTAAATRSPIKLGENNFVTYNSMMRNYWQKWTDEIDAAVAQGFLEGQTIRDIQSIVLDSIAPSKTGMTKTTLDRARRSARSIAITGTNHYANQSRREFANNNLGVIKGYEFLAVIDSRTSQQCRALDGKFFRADNPKISAVTPPLHPNCRSALVYSVNENFTVDDEASERNTRFDVDDKVTPKKVSTTKTYYEAMSSLSARDQDEILGPTLGKAFRKLNSPDEFSRFTIDSLGNPLTITEMKERDNALSRILNQ